MSGLEIDRRCDVYALGALLYELLTGTTPFESESVRTRTFLEIMRIVREEDPPTPSARLNTLGNRLEEVAQRRQSEPRALARLMRGDLDWIVMRAMEKDRRRRYDSASDLAEDLSRFFRHEPVTARRPSAVYRAGKFARRRRGPLLAAAAMAFAIMTGSAVSQVGTAGSRSDHGLPVIEPTLTRIVGSDTLNILDPALSPDGRWVAFSLQRIGALWIVSSNGGELRQLVPADASEATWFPEGDRIAYLTPHGIMTQPFDGRTGEATGSPRSAVPGRIAGGFRISPDGRWIAYRAWSDSLRMWIRIVPADGGEATTVVDGHGRVFLMDWSADGRYIYYRAQTPASRFYRVAITGGTPEEVRRPPEGASAPRVPYQITRISDQPAASLPLEVQTYSGSPVARIALPQGAFTQSTGRTFAAGGRQLLTVVSGSVAPVRVVPITGGAPRQIGEARAMEMPLAWSADGSEIFFATPLDGRNVIMRTSVAGGAAREVGLMPDRGPPLVNEWANPVTFSADGQYLSYSRPTPGSDYRTLVIRPVAGGRERIVTTSLFHQSAFRLAGPGGTPNFAGEDFLYLELRNGQVELRAVSPGGSSRLLRSFPEVDGTVPKGVFGRRVAYAPEPMGRYPAVTDAARNRIMVVDGPDGEEKEVAALPSVLAFDDIVWSPDGRWIAASAYVGELSNYTIKILVVGVTPTGDVFKPARLIDTPIIYAAWGLRWTPDGRSVVLTGQSPPSGRYDVWVVPVHGEGSPVAITSAEQDPLAFNVLSPDGRHVVYRSHVERGTSLWLADIGDALTRR